MEQVRSYCVLFESVEELNDVGGGADVDEQQLRQLVMREHAFRQHPSPEDEEQQKQLLQQPYQLLSVQLKCYNLPQVN